VSGQTNTTNLLQALSSTGSVLASIDGAGNLTVQAAIINANLTLNGHFISGGSTPTAAVGPAAGGGTFSISGDDTFGTITINATGSAISSGVLATITFNTAYGAAPRVVLSPDSSSAAASQFYKGTVNTTSFQIDVGAIPTAGAYTFDYFVGQ
jgi:hypothetical protein